MTPLRQRMLEDLELSGLKPLTQEAYVRAVRQLAEYYHKSPDAITEEELRQYFLHLIKVKKQSASTITVALCGIKFFYVQTLQRSWPTLELIRAPKEKKLPVVLSIEEVQRVLNCVQKPHHRACLQSIYACGLRISEGVHLQVNDIDGERMMIHVHRGKGSRDRYVPVPERALEMLRTYWVTHRNPTWLFPRQRPYNIPLSKKTEPLSESGVQRMFGDAVKRSGIHKHATVHTLRHSWATHLMEAGVPQRVIQIWLGHSSLNSTALYTHLTRKTAEAGADAINQLMEKLTW